MGEEKKKKADEARKMRLAAAAKKAGKEVEEGEIKADEKMEETVAEEPPAPVELTEEEMQIEFIKSDLKDISEKVFAKSYASFSLPVADEGFDEVRYDWDDASKCGETVRKFVLEQKILQKAEDLTPSDWFKEKSAEWQKALSEWKKKHSEWKDPKKRKDMQTKKAESLKKEGEETTPELPKIDTEDLDVFSVEDICDLGNAEPLFANFAYEDWTLLSTRYEMHLLLLAFKRDLDDPDRPTFAESHFPYYYQKYFKKSFNTSAYGCKSISEVVLLVKDTIKIDADSSMLKGLLPEETPLMNFVKLTEDHRRDRERRSDAGDETAVLKFTRTPSAPAGKPNPSQNPTQQKRPWQGAQGAPQPWKRPTPAYTPIPAFRRWTAQAIAQA